MASRLRINWKYIKKLTALDIKIIFMLYSVTNDITVNLKECIHSHYPNPHPTITLISSHTTTNIVVNKMLRNGRMTCWAGLGQSR